LLPRAADNARYNQLRAIPVEQEQKKTSLKQRGLSRINLFKGKVNT
jgi:hypothetical protein